MRSRRFSGSWTALDEVSENRTWDEHTVHPTGWQYADETDDWRFPEDTTMLSIGSELDDFSPEENYPVYPRNEGWRFSSHSSPLYRLPPSSVRFRSPATSWSPARRAPRTRFIAQNQWRDRRVAPPHPYKARGYRGFRAPVYKRRRYGCCCNPWSYRPTRYRPRRYRPGVTSWEHLPVAIKPYRWYEVVGRMQCSHCAAHGRHQMTSWMCQSCKVPLCLLPHRNCYAKWHGQEGEPQRVAVTYRDVRQ